MTTIRVLAITAISMMFAFVAGCEQRRTGSGSELDDETAAPKVTPAPDDTAAPRQGDLREGTQPYVGTPDTEAADDELTRDAPEAGMRGAQPGGAVNAPSPGTTNRVPSTGGETGAASRGAATGAPTGPTTTTPGMTGDGGAATDAPRDRGHQGATGAPPTAPR